MRKWLVANWKENPSSERKALQLFRGVAKAERHDGVEVIVCPPFVYLEGVADIFRDVSSTAKKNLALGAQDIFWEERGAYTSEIGPGMVRSLGARHVILGHSERRKYAKETDAMINQKIKSALNGGLHVILCVGESLAVRKKGIAAARAFVKDQLKKDLAGIGASVGGLRGKLTIAYEPIWAIGTGRNDSPQDAVAMSVFIKTVLGHQLPGLSAAGCRFLYGGSVSSKNIRDYVQYKGIDGALVGGASLRVEEFKKMIYQING